VRQRGRRPKSTYERWRRCVLLIYGIDEDLPLDIAEDCVRMIEIKEMKGRLPRHDEWVDEIGAHFRAEANLKNLEAQF
jgi:hypothetical protein